MRSNRLYFNQIGFNFRSLLSNNTVIVLTALISIFSPKTANAQSLLSEPQKIVIDAKRNRLLVSNYATGDIISIDSAGNQSYFKRNAGFVDGLEIVGDTIYGVGNQRRFRAYNLLDSQLVMDTTFAGASGNYLSSVASDSSGHLFISCPKLHTIYKMRISDRSYWVFAQNNGLNKPNGILLEKERNRIVVIGDAANASIYAISLADSSVSTLMTTSLYCPDGIVRDKFGNHYIGGYYLTGLYQTDSGFTQAPQMFFPGSTMVYPTYDPSDHSLLVTYYGTNGWGRVSPASVGIDQEKKSKRLNLNLYQNSPNPFNSSTTIRYHLSQPGKTRLQIFDMMGRLVHTLNDNQQQAGDYQIKWDGLKVSTGMYLCRLTTDRHRFTNKLILIK